MLHEKLLEEDYANFMFENSMKTTCKHKLEINETYKDWTFMIRQLIKTLNTDFCKATSMIMLWKMNENPIFLTIELYSNHEVSLKKKDSGLYIKMSKMHKMNEYPRVVHMSIYMITLEVFI